MSTNNDSKPTGLLTTLTSNKEVITVNSNQSATTITTRDRESGKVKTETFYGKNPLLGR